MVPTEALVSVDEYLRTEYDPDCDYMDGVLEERNKAERVHGELQLETAAYFRDRRKTLRVFP